MRKLILCLTIAFTACGTNDTASEDALATGEPQETAAATAAACKDRTPPAPKKQDEPGKTKPEVEVPDGAPPCDLVIQDIYEGKGDEAPEGSTVTVQYVGVSWSTGDEFDSSWDRGEPATFPLSGVVQGWQDGIPGMREGGRRRLIIPPDLAYGEAPPPGIAPNETLIFVIDLIDVATGDQ